jgi:hypothetical protein
MVKNDLMLAYKGIAIPDRMKHLDRDSRGFPIPWSVYRDRSGKAHFAINDEIQRLSALRGGLCPICGGLLYRGRWFVGGPISAFHENGAFADPPMHTECARYALMVCPYLAAPSYARRVDDRTLAKDDNIPLLLDPTSLERRPGLFVCLMATGQKITKDFRPNVIPRKPFVQVQYWREGKQLSTAIGEALVEAERPRWQAIIADLSRTPRLIKRSKS